MSVLVVAQPSSEVPEGLMNYSVYKFTLLDVDKSVVICMINWTENNSN